MADITYWFGRADVRDSVLGVFQVLPLDAGDSSLVKTLSTLSTSKQSDAAPDYNARWTVAVVRPDGGAVWIAAGENPVAVAGAAGAFKVGDGQLMPLALRPGHKIAAIDA